MTMFKEIDCRDTEEIVCPYCGREHSGSWEIIDVRNCSQEIVECANCKKKFLVEAEYHTVYFSSKADCLNGGEHVWYQWRFYGEKKDFRRCKGCNVLEYRPAEAST